jgi:hypothetical protein
MLLSPGWIPFGPALLARTQGVESLPKLNGASQIIVCHHFFGAKGFSALHKVSAGCARAGIDWAFVPGRTVSRLRQICDPQGTLPAASTIDAAIAEHHRKTGRT